MASGSTWGRIVAYTIINDAYDYPQDLPAD